MDLLERLECGGCGRITGETHRHGCVIGSGRVRSADAAMLVKYVRADQPTGAVPAEHLRIARAAVDENVAEVMRLEQENERLAREVVELRATTHRGVVDPSAASALRYLAFGLEVLGDGSVRVISGAITAEGLRDARAASDHLRGAV